MVKNTWFSKTYKKVWNEPLPLILNLYCLNDTTTIIKTHVFLGDGYNSLDKNDLSSGTECKESMGAGVKTVERQYRKIRRVFGRN